MKKIPLSLCFLISIAFGEPSSGSSNAYLGYKNYGLAKQQFDFERSMGLKHQVQPDTQKITNEPTDYKGTINHPGYICERYGGIWDWSGDVDNSKCSVKNEEIRKSVEQLREQQSLREQHELLRIQQEELNIQRQQQAQIQRRQEAQESRDAWDSIGQSLNSIGNAFNQSANQMNQDRQNRRTNNQLQQINNGINNLNSNSKLRPIIPNFY